MRCGKCVNSEGRKEGEGHGGGRDQVVRRCVSFAIDLVIVNEKSQG
jgi:hypothetical protein